MKFLKRSFLGLALGALAFSCADPDLGPIFTFETLGKGGYARLVQVTNAEFDLNNLSSTAFEYEVEFVTIDQGKNVASYDVFVSYNGGTEVLHVSYGQSDFYDNANGFKGIVVSLPLSDVLNTLGVAQGGLVGGDYIIFNTFVELTDGSRFGQANSTTAVNGSAFQGYFRNRINITCPLDDADFVGLYDISYDDPNVADGGFGVPFPDGVAELSLVSGSTTKRNVTAPGGGEFAWYFGFTYDVGEVEFVCDLTLLSNGFDTGAGCGGGSIDVANNGSGTFTFGDDGTFRIAVSEDDGGCGYSDKEFDIIFTKQ